MAGWGDSGSDEERMVGGNRWSEPGQLISLGGIEFHFGFSRQSVHSGNLRGSSKAWRVQIICHVESGEHGGREEGTPCKLHEQVFQDLYSRTRDGGLGNHFRV